ncbi:MAG: VCBS repeat-containing protein [Bacteroidota bacterium]
MNRNLQVLLGSLLLTLNFVGCSPSHDSSSPSSPLDVGDVPVDSLLVRQYCGSCHMVPDPKLLDKYRWEAFVLPRMGYMLGVYPDDSTRNSLFEDNLGGDRVKAAQVFPEMPVITPGDWEKIQKFYLSQAPDTILPPDKLAIQTPVPGFTPRIPRQRLSPPSTTLAHFTRAGWYIGDAHTEKVYTFLSIGTPATVVPGMEGAVNLIESRSDVFITYMGSFSPTDNNSGALIRYPRDDGSPSILIQDLQRPVHTAAADLNGDQRTDFVICEFAKWTGGLSWWRQEADGNFTRQLLKQVPGATRTVVKDFTGDGLPDILALFAQGDEGISLFKHTGNNAFEEERILRFPPSYGSSFFDVVDWDEDGDWDIIYTNGDNADYPPFTKPYHGIRLFENLGDSAFTEKWFLHLPGAYKVIPGDFDGDQDLDLAAISFFPDYERQPEAGFVYFQNQGEDDFSPFTFEESTSGRWLVMDAGDPDFDGDTDLLLGSLAFEVIPKGNWVTNWTQRGIPFIFLANRSKEP